MSTKRVTQIEGIVEVKLGKVEQVTQSMAVVEVKLPRFVQVTQAFVIVEVGLSSGRTQSIAVQCV